MQDYKKRELEKLRAERDANQLDQILARLDELERVADRAELDPVNPHHCPPEAFIAQSRTALPALTKALRDLINHAEALKLQVMEQTEATQLIYPGVNRNKWHKETIKAGHAAVDAYNEAVTTIRNLLCREDTNG